MSFTIPPNDPLFAASWHLLNTGQGGGTAGMDIRATSAWQHYIGRNILVAVLDDGVEASHPDLAANMWARPGGTTLVDAGNANLLTGLAVTPGNGSTGDNHGTSAAGVIGAVGNNGLGGVGVAPGVKLVSYRILGANNANTADGFQQAMNDGVQVLNNSWGTDAAFNTPSAASLTGIANLATQGRGGLGAIVVFANGNERSSRVSTQDLTGTEGALDATTGNRFTISVAAVENTSIVTDYSTRGSNLLVAAPGGQGDERLANGNGITTIDRVGATNGYNDQASPTGDYTGFNGTSAASPVVAGVTALILEANAGLGYRDMQEILAYTARQVDIDAGNGPNATLNRSPWVGTNAGNANGGGLKFSTDYGFGLVDAGAAVRLAETWTAVRTEANLITTTATAATTGAITAGGVATAQTFTTTFNLTQPGAAHTGLRINRIELDLGITAARPHDLTITLQSPGGTLITMARTPGNAFAKPGTEYDDAQPTAWPTGGFTINTPGFWGENAVGTWTLSVTASANAAAASSLDAATLRIFGDASNGADLRNMMVFTDDYGRLAGLEAGRATLGAGKTVLNAAPMSTAVTIDLRALDGGAQGTTIAGQAVTLAGTTLMDAYGGAGGDTLIGRAGANLLAGGWGNDTLLGGAGNDTLQGGFDDDILNGGVGADSMAGGQGNDQYLVEDATDIITEAANQGTDTAWVSATGWTMSTHIEILRLFGAGTGVTGSGNGDVMVANSGAASSIDGAGGDDVLWGGNAAHTLNGGAGDDIIRGQDGAVSMIGGAGNDQFVIGHIGATIAENADEGTDTA
ncbi:MAG: S8 family serine peptidase, partial [Alphaproteobacteria bacterium]|nr:S8 family serine peptidase [Alphaproteobacteria bacterium]